MENRNRWVMALLLLALIARIVAALAVGGTYHFADEAIYADAAHRLSNGDGFGSQYRNVPAYPVFLALLSLGLPVSLTFLRVAQAAVASLGVLVVFALADRLLGRRVAIGATLVYALDPLMVITSGLLYPETAAALLVPVLVLVAIDATERDSPGRSAIAGGLVGILALLRPVALILLPVVALWTVLAVHARPSRRLAHLAALGLAFLLVLTPWTLRNFRTQGRLVPVATAGTQAAPVGQDKVAREGLVVSMARWAWSEPGELLARVGRQFLQFWELTPTRMVTDEPATREALHERDPRLSVEPLFSRGPRDLVSAVSFGLELALAAVGLVAALRARRSHTVLMVALILAYAVGFALFVVKLRYRIPVLPLLFLFTGAGAAATYSLTQTRERSRERSGQGA